jgi:hypothetical protein
MFIQNSIHTTPGGATRGGWSGGKIWITEPIMGCAVKSQFDADLICNLSALCSPLN